MNAAPDAAPAFDEFADRYREILDESVRSFGEESDYFARYKARYVAAVATSGPARHILDYGCGVGMLARWLASEMSEVRVDGFDPSRESVARVGGALRARGVYTSELSELGREYDAIVVSNVLHHVPPPERQEVVAELARRLSPRGRLVVFEHNPLNPATRRVVAMCPFDHDAILLPRGETCGYARRAGLRVIRRDYVVFFPAALGPFRRVEPHLAWCPLGAQYAVVARRERPMTKPLVSVVVPVFNEEENVGPVHVAVTDVMRSLADTVDYEIVFTDNHSTDATFTRLSDIARDDPRVRVVRFSRNVGFQRSIFMGYRVARGDAVVQIDCDLQDPPALIAELVRRWREGAKVVYGVRRSRREGFFITALRRLFYRLIHLLAEDELPYDAGDFRLVDRQVVDELTRIYDFQPYLRGSIAAMGFDQVGVEYDRAERTRGRSKFSFGALVSLAVDGILNHSVVPLRIATWVGLTVSFVTFLGTFAYAVGRFYFGQQWPAGFATTTVLLLMSISLNALFLGIIGEYLGRIYKQVKRRPIAVIERTVNVEAPPPPADEA